MTSSSTDAVGMVHGRFQPFHLGHLEYLRLALAHSLSTLIIGVTNPARSEHAHAADDHRHTFEANPYSYLDRARMIFRSVRDLGDGVDILVQPFDLEDQTSWRVIPPHVIQYVNVLEEWDRVKCDRFRDYGFRVVTLHGPRLTSGTEVRDALRRRADVSSLLPAGSASVIGDIRRRLQS